MLFKIIIRKYWTHKNYKNNTFSVYLNWKILTHYRLNDYIYKKFYLNIKIKDKFNINQNNNIEYMKDIEFLTQNLITMVTYIETNEVSNRVYHICAFYFIIKPENIEEFQNRNFDITKIIILNDDIHDNNLIDVWPLNCNLYPDDPVIYEEHLKEFIRLLNNEYLSDVFMYIINNKKYEQKLGLFITLKDNVFNELKNNSKGVYINLNSINKLISANYEALMDLYGLYTTDKNPEDFFSVTEFYLNYYCNKKWNY